MPRATIEMAATIVCANRDILEMDEIVKKTVQQEQRERLHVPLKNHIVWTIQTDQNASVTQDLR